MSRAPHRTFATIHSEGALLPPDLLTRLTHHDGDLPHTDPTTYDLPPNQRLNEAATQAWNTLQGAWAALQDTLTDLPDDDVGTAVTRRKWLLPLLHTLGYGTPQPQTAPTIEGKTYPISHAYGHVPLHLVGYHVDLDTRTRNVAGAATTSPHSLLQEYLNRSDAHLWGLLSNGRHLRILRDNLALTRQAYLEFDLQTMMESDAYSDFVLLYRLVHATRLAAPDPHDTILETWSRDAAHTGTRILQDLANGVEHAITALGRGFLTHPHNRDLKHALRTGTLDTHTYYRELLRIVYRLLFLLVAEDRDALHPPDTPPTARERYAPYAIDELRRVANTLPGSRHPDAYERLKTTFHLLAHDGSPTLGLPALGGFLFSPHATPHLDTATLANHDLYRATRALTHARIDGVRRAIDYKNLGSEELGGVYEGLLERHPTLDVDTGTFTLDTTAGNERKTTGAYYTPTSLITLLLDTTLDPLIHERTHHKPPDEAERALLDLKILDPAVGSGHFLIAAAQRLGKRLAQLRTGDDEPAPRDTRTAIRDVVSRCLYGVDVNDMSAELCKVALWMEALEPGKPLTFLDHRIRVGNALLGTTPDLLNAGIPDAAYTPIEGDEKPIATATRKRNKEERAGQTALFTTHTGPDPTLATTFDTIRHLPTDTHHQLQAKERAWRDATHDPHYTQETLTAHAWTAAFVWPLRHDAPTPLTTNDLHTLRTGNTLTPHRMHHLHHLTNQYKFFHWHLAYPEVFHGPHPGFDAIIGNPPWERIKLQEQEWFATRDPDIANAPNKAKRHARIDALATARPNLHQAFLDAKTRAEGTSHYVRNSGTYPHTGRGDVNTYPLFAELATTLTHPTGRAGLILPTGIATDDTTKHYFQTLVHQRRIAALYDFENRSGLFPGIDSRIKFSVLSLTGTDHPIDTPEFAFFLHHPNDLHNPDTRITLTPDAIQRINPNTQTLPIFRTQRDAHITQRIYERFPVLIHEETGSNPWGVSFQQGLFNMTSDSNLFRTHDELHDEGFTLHGNHFTRDDTTYLPLYEAKMFHHYDPHYATYDHHTHTFRHVTHDEKTNPHFAPMPRYWVEQPHVERRLQRTDADGNVTWQWNEPWLLAFRDITNATNERTAIFSVIPRVAVNHKAPLLFLREKNTDHVLAFLTITSSFVFDFVARQKLGGTSLTYFILKQLPMPTPSDLDPKVIDQLSREVDRLPIRDTLTAHAKGGATVHPERTTTDTHDARANLDAIVAHVYGLDRDDLAYVLDTFTTLKAKEEKKLGTFQTKQRILDAYDHWDPAGP